VLLERHPAPDRPSLEEASVVALLPIALLYCLVRRYELS